eukprot:100718-Chlamydomonas_euryale.AAC.1
MGESERSQRAIRAALGHPPASARCEAVILATPPPSISLKPRLRTNASCWRGGGRHRLEASIHPGVTRPHTHTFSSCRPCSHSTSGACAAASAAAAADAVGGPDSCSGRSTPAAPAVCSCRMMS